MEVVYVVIAVVAPDHTAGIPVAAFTTFSKAQEFVDVSKKPEKFSICKLMLDILNKI